MNDIITLNHGSGGRITHKLIEGLFKKHFKNKYLENLTDSSIIDLEEEGSIAFTTDSFVVDPIFFPGGDIGKLAVCGTINDLAVSGAIPFVISSAFIIEEGFAMNELETIVKSMQQEANYSGVKIVTGDTKVLPKGKCDKIFINTSGIGKYTYRKDFDHRGLTIKAGDKIIVSGTLADHGMTILKEREQLDIQADLRSDCACLNHMIEHLFDNGICIKFMRDPTRGGLATTLCEVVEEKKIGIAIDESAIPVNSTVQSMCDLLGFDPLYVANEGKVMMIVAEEDATAAIRLLQETEEGGHAALIGEVTNRNSGMVTLITTIGGTRIIDMLVGDQLPRIC